MSQKPAASAAAGKASAPKPRLTRGPYTNTSTNGLETAMDPDAPRPGRLASLQPRPTPSVRGGTKNLAFKPNIVPRRRKDDASSSLLFSSEDAGLGPSDNRIRRADRGRGRGRGRGAGHDVPLVASGPFAQGPAQGPATGGHGSSRSAMGSRVSVQPHAARSSTTVTPKTESKSELKVEQEAILDDEGQPMQNLQRMQSGTANFWAPISTSRIERTVKDTPIAQPEDQGKFARIKKEEEDCEVIDIKTERTESTLTSRVPSPEAKQSNAFDDLEDVEMLMKIPPQAEQDEDDDIVLPGGPPPSSNTTKSTPKVEKKDQDVPPKTLSVAEIDEQVRNNTDLARLRESLSEPEQLFFIQLPDVLPLWAPSAEDDKAERIVKEEEPIPDIVKIDQKLENSLKVKSEPDTRPNSSSGVSQSQVQGTSNATKVKIETSATVTTAAAAAAPVHTNEPVKRTTKKPTPVAFPPPEGLLGHLNIHKSGRISCTWGGITFDISAGSDCGFLQEVVAINHKDRKAESLGRIQSRIILTPDLDKLLGKKG